jgi:hypothetical protein
MRLVQRHGRIDRIGSPHQRVFLRTIFPAERLDQLLNLEQRIMEKIAMAAASVGVVAPVDGGASGEQVFTETREEIERLMDEDPTLYERGGTGGAGQTGEEYRQTLRKELDRGRDRLRQMPYGIGSGMAKGSKRGIFFCASIGERTYLRFVPATGEWSADENAPIIREIGTCLRLIECEPETRRHVPQQVEDAVFEVWDVARQHIHASWMTETDPANLQPKVPRINHRVAEFIRANRPHDIEGDEINLALDILEAPWPTREATLLREQFNADQPSDLAKSEVLVEFILETGLEPFEQPPLLPPIELDDVRLVCWMAIDAAA